MKTVIAGAQGPWHEAVAHILTESSLLQMSIWIGGLFFALAAVLSARSLSRYVAIRCNEIVSRMEASRLSKDTQDDVVLEQVASQYIMAKVHAKRPDAPEVAHGSPLSVEAN